MVCPIVNTVCPIVNTVCPIVNTVCAIVNTVCPIVNTVCPLWTRYALCGHGMPHCGAQYAPLRTWYAPLWTRYALLWTRYAIFPAAFLSLISSSIELAVFSIVPNIGWAVQSFSSSLCNLLHSPVTSSLLGPNMSWNLGTLTSWNPLGHSRPVTGLIYLLVGFIIRIYHDARSPECQIFSYSCINNVLTNDTISDRCQSQ